MIKHQWHIERVPVHIGGSRNPWGPGYRAKCSCGWFSVNLPQEWIAKKEGAAHALDHLEPGKGNE